jgi:arylsulfatase
VATEHCGTLRDQFVFAADIVPTVYDLVGVRPPDVRRGLEQLPVTGHSFAHVLADADAASRNTVQYFENGGSRAIVAEGWKAVCKHTPGTDFETEPWELYDLRVDRSECHDLAAEQPERLRALIERWWEEAERHGVLPLDDRGVELFGARFRPRSPHPVDRRYVYRPPMSPMPGQASAAIGGRSFDLTARVEVGVGDEGVLFATGTQNSGLSLFVQDGRLVLDYNAFGAHTILESEQELVAGPRDLVLRMRRGDGFAGTAALEIDGEPAGATDLDLYMRMMSSIGPSIGADHGSPVSARYRAPFTFTGTLHEIEIQLVSPRAPGTAEATARAEMSRQ